MQEEDDEEREGGERGRGEREGREGGERGSGDWCFLTFFKDFRNSLSALVSHLNTLPKSIINNLPILSDVRHCAEEVRESGTLA